MPDRLTVSLRSYSGAHVFRLSDIGEATIPEHAHDWPVLSLFVAGSYRNWSDLGETCVSQPSAMFYRPGEPHSNAVGKVGLEQIDIEFDPSWLNLKMRPSWSPVANWKGGAPALMARQLARLWSNPAVDEQDLAASTREFLIRCFDSPPVREPGWLPDAMRLIEQGHAVTATQIAGELDLHPGWVAESYRAAVGEGIGETVRRRRVESAVRMLVTSAEPQAQVAAAAGFCDQSHMIRSFQAVLGRTPRQVRAERAVSAPFSPS